jgi:murein DD-endopeptidase MepM/ murein hydrolase activator NlpD
MESQNTYHLPLDIKNIEAVASDPRTHNKSVSKEGYSYDLTNAIDFLCKEGSPIKAALEGKVVFIQDGITNSWHEWRVPPEDVLKESEQDGNFVLIEHGNREFSSYSHLMNKGIKVKVGDYVKTGQIIGESGDTGWSIKPHLHYVTRRFLYPMPRKDFESLETTWIPKDAEWIKKKLEEKNNG